MSRFRRLAVTAALGVSLALGATGGALRAYAGEGVVSTYGNEAVATKIVTLGDSVPAGTACDCDDYGKVLAQETATTSGGATVTNFGKPGETSDLLVSQLGIDEVRQAVSRADVVVITIGANDVSTDDAADPTPAAAGMGRQVDQALATVTALAPHARVVVTGYWNVVQDGEVAAEYGADYVAASRLMTDAVNTELRRAADAHHVLYADLAAAYRDAAPDVTTLLADDGDHPNAAGHQVIAHAVQDVLRPPSQTRA